MNLNNQCVKTVTKAIASGSCFQSKSVPQGKLTKEDFEYIKEYYEWIRYEDVT